MTKYHYLHVLFVVVSDWIIEPRSEANMEHHIKMHQKQETQTFSFRYLTHHVRQI